MKSPLAFLMAGCLACGAGLESVDACAQQAPAPSAAAQAQDSQAPAPPILKAESKVVRVDVIVTDKKGNYVQDLTAREFHVFDNNKGQPIANFSFGASGDNGPSAERHYIVLFFDDASMRVTDQPGARQAALKFIDANVGLNRVMAVVDFTGALRVLQNFTANAERLKKAAGTSKNSPVTISETPESGPAESLDSAGPALSMNQFGVDTFLLAIRGLAMDLAAVPGRKNLVLFTEGFPATPEQQSEMSAAISACNQANVAIYPLDVRGLAGSPVQERRMTRKEPGAGGSTGFGGDGTLETRGIGFPSSPSESSYHSSIAPQTLVPTFPDAHVADNQSLLDQLAQSTGGFPIYNTNDLPGGLAKIAHEQDEYYFVGYAPADGSTPGCHNLKVKVDRPGTVVRSRTGYCNAKPADLLAGKPIEKDLEARASVPVPPSGGMAGSLEAPFVYTSPDIARVNVALEIPSSAIEFSQDKAKYHADVNILAIAYRPDGSVGARFSDEIKLDLGNDELKKFLEKPLLYGNQFQVAAGKYNLAVVLSGGEKKFGKYETPLVIEPYDGKTFAMSAITLSDVIEPLSGPGAALETDLLSDRAPLIFGNFEVVPSATNRFKHTETVALYAQIYDPLLSGDTPGLVKLSYNIVDLKTGQGVVGGRNIDLTPYVNKGNSMLPVGIKLPIDRLQPGSYRLDVQAYNDDGQRTPIRSVKFDAE